MLSQKVNSILHELESLGNEKLKAQNIKRGAGQNQFGVKMGDIRKIAGKIKKDHALGLALWETNQMEARFLACLILDPKLLTNKELTAMVSSENYAYVVDWLYNYIIKDYADKQTLRIEWIKADNLMLQRLAWSLISGNVTRNPDLEDIHELLHTIEDEMGQAPYDLQWTMNTALAQIGIKHPEFRERALTIGHKLGVLKDYPVSKGCTSPFAPIWIEEMVKRESN